LIGIEYHKTKFIKLGEDKFGNLGKALQYAYPEIDWDISKFSNRGKKSTQRWLRVKLAQILPEKTKIYENFLH